MNQKKKTIYILLIIIMIAGVCRYSYAFFVEKQGNHSDEEWSFGLANSYYEPYIYSSDNGLYLKNNNQWLSGTVLRDYLTVQEDERFSFDSVYYNMECDMHPPLYFFILHFLSSFFVNQYVEALGLLINIIAYIITSVFIYKTLTLITKSQFVGLMGVLFNTFTVGALSMTIFLRMYAMSAMFATMLAYVNARIYYDKEYRNHFPAYIKLALVTTLGALTHHFFLPYAFMLTAVMCICWLVKKEWKALTKYAGFMILGVALSIAVFPATLDHLFGIETVSFRDEGVYTTSITKDSTNVDSSATDYLSLSTDEVEHYQWNVFKYYWKFCTEMLFEDQFAFSPVTVYSRGYMIYSPIVLMLLVLFMVAACFLFRKETWYIKLSHKIIHSLRSATSKIKQCFIHFNWLFFSFVMSILFILMITVLRVDVIYMGSFTSRYLFIIYPIFNILSVILLYKVCKIITRNKTIVYRILMVAFSMGILLYSNICNESLYLQKDTKNTKLLSSIATDSDFIIVSSNTWLFTLYCPLLYKSNQVYYTTYADFKEQKDSIEENQSDKDLYLILDTSLFSESNESGEYTMGNMIMDEDSYRAYTQKFTNAKDLELTPDAYLSYIESFSNVSDLEYMGDIFNSSYTMSIYKLR